MTVWTDFQSASIPEILAWAEDQLWARSMAACGQDVGWHAEGDVWTHTRLVVEQLPQLAEWATLSTQDQLILIMTALFHDSGKPATTRQNPETKRIHAPQHAVVGMEIARSVLRELGCELPVREAICQLVRYHGRPPFLFEKGDPVRELIRLSWLCDVKLLYFFALADTRGRSCVETGRPEEVLELGRLLAEESQCFGKRYPFANDTARLLYFRDRLSSLHYEPHEEYRCTVTMMAGLPGSGKDTWLERHPAGPIVSLDDIRHDLEIEPTDNQGTVIQTAREQCREWLRSRNDFAFNATNIMELTRTRWIDLWAEYGARIEIVYLEPSLAAIHKQNRSRDRDVPQSAMDRLITKLEPPTWLEAHGVRLIGSV